MVARGRVLAPEVAHRRIPDLLREPQRTLQACPGRGRPEPLEVALLRAQTRVDLSGRAFSRVLHALECNPCRGPKQKRFLMGVLGVEAQGTRTIVPRTGGAKRSASSATDTSYGAGTQAS